MPKFSKVTIFIVIIIFISVNSVLCVEKMHISNADQKKRSVSIQETEKHIQHEETRGWENSENLYNPLGKIDPFAPLFLKMIKRPTPDIEIPLKCERTTPLQELDLSQYRLKAVLWAASGKRALVIDSLGKGYIVKYDTLIGINCGKVIDILKDRIVVEEKTQNILNRMIYKKRELLIDKQI